MVGGEATFMTEDGSSGVTEVGINELSGYDSVTEKGLPWRLLISYQRARFEYRTICKMCI